MILSLLFSALFSFASVPSKVSKVLVYQGPGGCKSCAEAAARSAEHRSFKVVYVGPSEVTADIFKGAIAWIQPAGDGIKAAEALGAEKMALIKNYVNQGGAYLGFCAGAFLADTIVDDFGKVHGIGLLPFSSADYHVNQDDNIDMVWTEWLGKKRHIFFNTGATFEIPNSMKRDIHVLATYAKDNKPATLSFSLGKGMVVVSGAHPEAPAAWLTKFKVKDLDGSDLDLAQELFDIATKKIKVSRD